MIRDSENLSRRYVTPAKILKTTDKDGKKIWCCPFCKKILVKFWSEVETIRPTNHCSNCGQRLEWNIHER